MDALGCDPSSAGQGYSCRLTGMIRSTCELESKPSLHGRGAVEWNGLTQPRLDKLGSWFCACRQQELFKISMDGEKMKWQY